MEDVLKNIIKVTHDITYGWIDKNNIKHTQAKKNFFIENYRYSSVEDTLKNRVGTCFEIAALMKYYLDQNSIDGDNYIIMYNIPDKICKHATCVAYIDNKYYLVENSWILEEPVLSFDTLNDLLVFMIKRFPKMYKLEPFDPSLIEVYKYSNPKVGLSYEEFVNYVKQGEKIEVNI
jgi:hypothetical protein